MCSLEHSNLNIDADCFFNETTFLVETCGLWPLLHLLANASDLNDQVLVRQFLSNLHATGHTSHLDGCSGNTSIALSVVLFNINALVSDLR